MVIAGPIEATAIGNILMQAIALGDIPSVKDGREIVRNSFCGRTYQPHAKDGWDDNYRRFKENLALR